MIGEEHASLNPTNVLPINPTPVCDPSLGDVSNCSIPVQLKPVTPAPNPNSTLSPPTLGTTAAPTPAHLASTPPGSDPQTVSHLTTLLETGENPNELKQAEVEIENRVHRYIPKILAAGLVIQGIYGIYKSVNFLLIEYPLLEQQLLLHQVTQDQINTFASKAVIIIISTILSMIFALRLAILHTKTAHYIHTVIGVLLFLGNTYIYTYLNQHDSGVILSKITIQSVYIFQRVSAMIPEQLPFAQKDTSTGQWEFGWFQ